MSEQELRDALWQLHTMQHDSEEDDIWCESCGVIWPCPTVKVLREGEDIPDDVMHARREEEAWAAAAYRAASALPALSRATAKGTAIDVDEWDRPLYVLTHPPDEDRWVEAVKWSKP